MQQSPSLATFSYSVLVGQDEAFEAWLRNLLMLVVAAPGFVGVNRAAQESPPGASRWKLTCRFESASDREGWMRSTALARAHAEAGTLFASPPQATADAEGGASRMTMVVTSQVAPGHEEDWRAAQARLNASVVGFPGFDGLEIFKPSDDSRTWTTVLTFRSERDLENWKNSADRRHLLSQFEETKHDSVDVGPTSFGTWFARATAARPVPEWKQAMVVLAVLYPLVSFYDITLGNAAGQGLAIAGHQVIKGLGLPFPFVVFLGNAIGTVLLTWVLMPAAIGLFNWWLDPAASRERTISGALILVALYVLEVAAFSYVFETWGF